MNIDMPEEERAYIDPNSDEDGFTWDPDLGMPLDGGDDEGEEDDD